MRREVGHTRDAGWEIGVSKTVDHPVEHVWSFITSPGGIAIWLGEGVTVLPERGAGYETADGVHGETRG
ncbi:MAG: SRPBCC domain-containing protein, partial [Actinophytocola sp.]